MKRIGVALLLLASALLLLTGCTHSSKRSAPMGEPVVQIAAKSSPSQSKQALARCAKPAPSTARGFTQMFAALPPEQWGAADVSISVPLADGRVLWLYGDTFSAGRFVHSSAIVQDRGCLHVVNGGAQLLPNVDARHIYWIRSAEVSGDGQGVVIVARAITLTGTGPWDFADGGYDQWMSLWLDRNGDAAHTIPVQYGWGLVSPLGPAQFGAAPDPGPMYSYGPHHFGYARHAHPEFKLASGRRLYTTAQNFDDGKPHPIADYRPIFSER